MTQSVANPSPWGFSLLTGNFAGNSTEIGAQVFEFLSRFQALNANFRIAIARNFLRLSREMFRLCRESLLKTSRVKE